MGNRDDNSIDDERADMLLRRTLEREEQNIPTAPDLVARALNRLPPGPPAVAARRLQARRRNRMTAIISVVVPLVLLACLNIWSVAAHGPQMAFMFGDGQTGLSGMLLGLHLVAKPIWNTLRTLDTTVVLGSLLGVGVCVIVLRWLVRRVQGRYEVEGL